MPRDAADRLSTEPDVGRVADSVVAARLGISRKTVLAWRKRMGIRAFDDPAPTFRPPAPTAPAAVPTPPPPPDPRERSDAPRRSRPSRLDAFLDVLGSLPDRAIAEQAGVSPENVRMYRQRRGIAAGWRGGSSAPTRVEVALAAVEAEIGRVPDAVIAQRVGVSRSAVTQYRAKKGIPAGRRDAGSMATPGPAHLGFEVRLRTTSGEETVNVLAPTATAAVSAAAQHGEVLSLRRIGRVL